MTTVFNTVHRAPTRGRPRPSAVVAVLAGGAAIAWACVVGTSAKDDRYEPTRIAIAKSEVDHVLGPTTAEFAAAAASLRDATATWSTAVDAGEDATASRDAARAAWRTAVDVWQRAEVLQVGPAGSSAFVIGGADLRDEIYAWPTIDACRIDEELTAENYTGASFFTDTLVNVRGLAAVEYLLFVDTEANACAADQAINQDGSWAALGTEVVAKRRAAYAARATARVAELATELAATWEPGSGEFARWLARPGEAGSPYDDGTEALDDLFGASSYIDTIVKDHKLGATQPDALESPWSQRSKEHTVANLEGLRSLVLGGSTPQEGTGFDDLLVELGEQDLADELLAAIDDAIAAASAIDGSYEDALAADPAALAPVQGSVETLVDLVKGPVTAALMLSRPGEAAGDAD